MKLKHTLFLAITPFLLTGCGLDDDDFFKEPTVNQNQQKVIDYLIENGDKSDNKYYMIHDTELFKVRLGFVNDEYTKNTFLLESSSTNPDKTLLADLSLSYQVGSTMFASKFELRPGFGLDIFYSNIAQVNIKKHDFGSMKDITTVNNIGAENLKVTQDKEHELIKSTIKYVNEFLKNNQFDYIF